MHIDPSAELDSDPVALLSPAAAGAAGAADAAGAGDPARWERLSAHWRAWLPILMRGAAMGLALLGLAGIGLAARGSSELPVLARAPLAAGFAQMLGPGPLLASAAAAAPGAAASGGVGAGTEVPASEGQGPPAQCACAEPVPCAAAPRSGQPAADVAGAGAADGRVILNQAGALELQRLPGIGAKRAAAILELRGRIGRFRRTTDLLRVKGIGRRLLERMSPQLLLDAPVSGVASAAPGAL